MKSCSILLPPRFMKSRCVKQKVCRLFGVATRDIGASLLTLFHCGDELRSRSSCEHYRRHYLTTMTGLVFSAKRGHTCHTMGTVDAPSTVCALLPGCVGDSFHSAADNSPHIRVGHSVRTVDYTRQWVDYFPCTV